MGSAGTVRSMAWTRSQQTFLAAISRITKRYDTRTVDLPERLLAPDEVVHEVLVGDTRSDANPFLLVTDRRVLVARLRMLRGWHVVAQAPAPDITGAEYTPTVFSGRLRVGTRGGADLELVSDDRAQAERVVGLVRHLVAGGAQPEPVLIGAGSGGGGTGLEVVLDAGETLRASALCSGAQGARGAKGTALLVTDRRVLLTSTGLLGWRVDREIQLGGVLGAELTGPGPDGTTTIIVHGVGGRRFEAAGVTEAAGRAVVDALTPPCA